MIKGFFGMNKVAQNLHMFNKQLGGMAIQELQFIVKVIQEMTPPKK